MKNIMLTLLLKAVKPKPIFKKRLKIIKDRKEWHRDSGVYIIEDAILEEK